MNKTSIIDLSCGDSHIREIAEESGIDYLQYHSSEKTIQKDGFTIETWYDEDASSALSAWGAFIKGVGSSMAESLELAIEGILKRARA